MLHALTHAWRTLLRPGSVGFAATATATLALGIAGVISVYSLLDAVLFAPLPFRDEARIVRIAERNAALALTGFAVSAPNFRSWRERARSFDAFAAYQEQGINLRDGLGIERVDALVASPGLEAVTGLAPVLGRHLTASDEDRDGALVVTESTWTRRFARNANVLGRSVSVDGRERTIVGVVPDDVGFGRSYAVWLPLDPRAGEENRGDRRLTVLARLADGVGVAAASEEIGHIATQLAAEHPDDNEGWDAQVEPVRAWLVGPEQRERLTLLMVAVALLLVVSCANVASLQVARGTQRLREFGIRQAIGAHRGSLLRLVLAETLVLTLAGAALGVVLAAFALQLVAQGLQADLPTLVRLGVEPRVAAIAIGASALVAIAFGLLPARTAMRAEPVAVLSGGARSGLGGTHAPLRRALVVAQFAVALVLTAGALLLAQRLLTLTRTDLGFDPGGLVTADLSLPELTSDADLVTQRIALDRLLTELAAMPGVESVAIASEPPFGDLDTQMLVAPGPMPVEVTDASRHVQSSWRIVSSDYFRTFGIRLIDGRAFAAGDAEPGDSIILGRTVAERLYPDKSAVGRMVTMGNGQRRKIVGVVDDVHQRQVADGMTPSVYMPTTWYLWNTMTVVARTSAEPAAIATEMRRRAAAVLPGQPLFALSTMTDALRASTAGERTQAALVTVFAFVALLIAAVGLGSVTAYLVARRSTELALRVALGAAPERIRRSVLGEAIALAIAGVAVGTLLAVPLRALVPLRDAGDVTLAFAVAAVLLLAACLVAAWLPARRAAATDPNHALRSE